MALVLSANPPLPIILEESELVQVDLFPPLPPSPPPASKGEEKEALEPSEPAVFTEVESPLGESMVVIPRPLPPPPPMPRMARGRPSPPPRTTSLPVSVPDAKPPRSLGVFGVTMDREQQEGSGTVYRSTYDLPDPVWADPLPPPPFTPEDLQRWGCWADQKLGLKD